ncbi:MAG: rhodanese-like domain-containing protein [Bacteroidota bacterium]
MSSLFDNLGIVSNGVISLSPKEAFEICHAGAILIDIREEYLNAHKTPDVPEVICLPYSQFESAYHKLPQDKNLIIFDSSGIQGREAALFLLLRSYKYIANMAGGFVEWERDKLAIKENIKERLRGSCMCQIKYRDIDSKK